MAPEDVAKGHLVLSGGLRRKIKSRVSFGIRRESKLELDIVVTNGPFIVTTCRLCWNDSCVMELPECTHLYGCIGLSGAPSQEVTPHSKLNQSPSRNNKQFSRLYIVRSAFYTSCDCIIPFRYRNSFNIILLN